MKNGRIKNSPRTDSNNARNSKKVEKICEQEKIQNIVIFQPNFPKRLLIVSTNLIFNLIFPNKTIHPKNLSSQ
jgi:hypothetical protein